MNSFRSIKLNLKYQKFKPSGWKNIGIRIFLTKTKFLPTKTRTQSEVGVKKHVNYLVASRLNIMFARLKAENILVHIFVSTSITTPRIPSIL